MIVLSEHHTQRPAPHPLQELARESTYVRDKHEKEVYRCGKRGGKKGTGEKEIRNKHNSKYIY